MKKISVSLTLMACLGMLLPPAALAESPAAKRQVQRTLDVSLHQDGLIVGQVVNPQGVAQPETQIAVVHNGSALAHTKTDEMGRFAVKGLQPGVYQLATSSSVMNVRAWSKELAPPKTALGAMLVSGDSVNGQCHCNGGGTGAHSHAATYGNGTVVDGSYVGTNNGAASFNQGGSGQVMSTDGGVVSYGDAGATYVDGSAAYYGGSTGGSYAAGYGGAGYGASYAGAASGAGGGLFSGGLFGGAGVLSSPWLIGAGVAAAVAIPVALDDDDAS